MTNALIRLIIVVCLIASCIVVRGQDALFSQFFATPVFLNPAFAGTGDCARLVFNYRNRPFPDFGTFSSFNVSYDQPVSALGGGIGFLVTSDFQSNLIMRHNISAMYSLHLQLSRSIFMNLALQAGYMRKDLNWHNLVFANQYNSFFEEILPITESPPERTWRQSVSFSTGMLLFSNIFYGGIALHHLNRPKESLFSDDYRLPLKGTLHIGLNLPLPHLRLFSGDQQNFFVSPNIIFVNQGVISKTSYGLYVGFEQVAGGLWLRHDSNLHETLIFMLGLKGENYRIAYSYDHSLSGLSGVFQGAHEISVILNLFCGTKKSRQRIINSPSF
ncbi:MAG TPA: PorP/SprF family type IX secretion system membrane protein [Bacteroidales bacterium]|nr:PorP/SprF family type IX secretion system membrane protein [Bacteroidales bacterium]